MPVRFISLLPPRFAADPLSGVLRPREPRLRARSIRRAQHSVPGCMERDRYAEWRDLLLEDPTDLKVRFLDGPEELRRRVIVHAQTWKNFANVGFDFRGSDQADIRISFAGKGSWSYVGTNARELEDETKPTMNLDVRLDTPEQSFRRVVLHEFGHALGLVHEHQIDDGNPIQWNEAAVIQAHAGIWDEAKVRSQILVRYKSGSFFNWSSKYKTTKFDPKSIMLYPIPQGFTRNGFSVGWNNELSDGDRAFIAAVYGKPKRGF